MDVLIIGLGSIAAKHILSLNSLQEKFNIYALRTTEGNNVEGVTNIYSISELPRLPSFAIVSNPTQFHFQTITSLACLNIPMFIEKPPLHTLDEIETVIDQINEKNILTYVACNLRFHPCIQFLKSHLQAGDNIKINEVNVYCGSYLPDWRPEKNYKKTYSANKEMGGGVHLDLFHEMDYTCWLFGYPNSSYGFKSNKSSLEINADDYANYILEYPEFNVSIILNYYRNKAKRTIEVLFAKETWIVDLIQNTIYSDNGVLVFQSTDFKIVDTYINQMHYFVSCLKGNLKTINPITESIKVLKLSLNV
jgi:predicted dehydrogenase